MPSALAEERYIKLLLLFSFRLREVGKNQLSQKKKTPWYIKLLHELTGMFALLLWIGGLLCFLAFILDQSDPSNVINI